MKNIHFHKNIGARSGREREKERVGAREGKRSKRDCLLYTSDAADE